MKARYLIAGVVVAALLFAVFAVRREKPVPVHSMKDGHWIALHHGRYPYHHPDCPCDDPDWQPLGSAVSR